MFCKYWMNNKQIREFVESVAEIKLLKPVKDSGFGEDETRVVFKGEWIELNKEINPTLGFKFIKLKPVERDCQLGCGERVVDQRIEKRLAFTPVRHWRTRCTNCQNYVHPNGQELIRGGHQVQLAYLRFFNKEE